VALPAGSGLQRPMGNTNAVFFSARAEVTVPSMGRTTPNRAGIVFSLPHLSPSGHLRTFAPGVISSQSSLWPFRRSSFFCAAGVDVIHRPFARWFVAPPTGPVNFVNGPPSPCGVPALHIIPARGRPNPHHPRGNGSPPRLGLKHSFGVVPLRFWISMGGQKQPSSLHDVSGLRSSKN